VYGGSSGCCVTIWSKGSASRRLPGRESSAGRSITGLRPGSWDREVDLIVFLGSDPDKWEEDDLSLNIDYALEVRQGIRDAFVAPPER
jgi:hypothetical protein